MRAEHPLELVVLDFAQGLGPRKNREIPIGALLPPPFCHRLFRHLLLLGLLFFPLVSDFFSASLFFATTYDPPDFPDFLSRSIERIEWAAWAAWLITCFCTRSR